MAPHEGYSQEIEYVVLLVSSMILRVYHGGGFIVGHVAVAPLGISRNVWHSPVVLLELPDTCCVSGNVCRWSSETGR